jgi:hypothetical protein
MKKVGLLVLGAGIAIAIGSAAYYLYKEYQRKKALMSFGMNEEEELIPEKADVKEVMAQCLAEGMPVIFQWKELAIQAKNKEAENVPALKKRIREKCKVKGISVVEDGLKTIEKSMCRKLDWDIKDYYIELVRKKQLNDPYHFIYLIVKFVNYYLFKKNSSTMLLKVKHLKSTLSFLQRLQRRWY